MASRPLSQFIGRKLINAGWQGISYDNNSVSYPNGKILKKYQNSFTLRIVSFNQLKKEYGERKNYQEITFPIDFPFRYKLRFKSNGNYKLVAEKQFKKITNPQNKTVKNIKLIANNQNIEINNDTLVISVTIFKQALLDAKNIEDVSYAYQDSIENYLIGKTFPKYVNFQRKNTTYLKKGEFNFLIDKFNLPLKKNKKDFLAYLDNEDIKALEDLTTRLIKNDVLSDTFLRMLDEYFIKEKLQSIIELGKKILSIGRSNLETSLAKKIKAELNEEQITSLEALWQEYFRRYLLYLIFSYKKIFPKVQLENIQGEKKYPDFIGVNHYFGVDVIEIKTHLKNILVWDSSHKNFYFSPETSKAIVQTLNYLDSITKEKFNKEEDKRKIINSTFEENLYHPRGIIIISSKNRLTTKKGHDEELKRDFTKLRNSIQNIEILTFDEIIGIASEYISNINSQNG